MVNDAECHMLRLTEIVMTFRPRRTSACRDSRNRLMGNDGERNQTW